MAALRAAHAFSIDLAKMRSIALAGRRGRRAWIAFCVQSSELHCVAAYRFGRFADRVRARKPLMGLPFVVLHRVWNRWNTHLHHCDISRKARIGAGFMLMHRNGVLIGPVRIGSNAVVHHQVTIGQRAAGGDHGVPTIGDNVWIGPGAIITGDISIGDGATISAGAVVSRDIPAHALVAGNPGRVIANDYDNSALVNYVITPGSRASVHKS